MICYLIFSVLIAAAAFTVRRRSLLRLTGAAFYAVQAAFAVRIVAGGLYGETSAVWFAFDAAGTLFYCLLCIVSAFAFFHSKASLHDCDLRQTRTYAGLLMLLTTAIAGAYFASNLAVTWIFLEATTLCSAGIVYHRRTAQALEAAWKYVFVCSTGIAMAYLGILLLAAATDCESLDYATVAAAAPGGSALYLKTAFLLILCGYSCKAELFPLYTVGVDANFAAPAPASALISTGLVNAGFLALLRVYKLLAATEVFPWVKSVLLLVGVLSLVVGALFLLLAMLINGLSSCTPLLQGGLQALVIATYPAEDEDILAAERYYKGLEDELQQKIDRYAAEHSQFDEFQYDLARIWHDPHALISIISAHANGEWKIDGVYGFLNRLFEEQYTLSQKVKSETRYRKEWVKHYEKIVDPETGEITWRPYQVLEDVPYTYRTCTVKLEIFNLSHLPFYVLSRKGVGRYAMYISVLGNREDLFRGNPYASTLREPGKHDVPEAYLEDETFRRILEEAEKYIGYPYVWGGDSPETSFDCSGFVSYVFTNSGVRNVGRLGATSLYGACQKITPEEAKPGDLVFFEKTISGVDGITHCGIYVGDGFMLHCGSPIGYADLRDSYWQQHFFGYGRLVRE